MLKENQVTSLIKTMLDINKERQVDESENDNDDSDDSDGSDDSDNSKENNDNDDSKENNESNESIYSDDSENNNHNDKFDPAVPNEIYDKKYKLVYLPYQSRISEVKLERKIHRNYTDFKIWRQVNFKRKLVKLPLLLLILRLL